MDAKGGIPQPWRNPLAMVVRRYLPSRNEESCPSTSCCTALRPPRYLGIDACGRETRGCIEGVVPDEPNAAFSDGT
jgi:hypothetical protein